MLHIGNLSAHERDKLIGKVARQVNNILREKFGEVRANIDVPGHVVAAIREKPLDPRASHNAWRKARIDDGWTGGEYDAEKKTHPNLNYPDWDSLPFEQKVKDFTVFAVIKAIDFYEDSFVWKNF